jgi:hypothetical protein
VATICVFIGVRIIKEMLGSVASGTHCRIIKTLKSRDSDSATLPEVSGLRMFPACSVSVEQ